MRLFLHSILCLIVLCLAQPATAQSEYRIRSGEHVAFEGDSRISLSTQGTIEIWFKPEWSHDAFRFASDAKAIDLSEKKAVFKITDPPGDFSPYSIVFSIGGPDKLAFALWVDPRTTAGSDEGSWLGVSNSLDSIRYDKSRIQLRNGKKLTSGTWHHVALVSQPGKNAVDVYVDGEQQDSLAATFGDTANLPLRLGWLFSPRTRSKDVNEDTTLVTQSKPLDAWIGGFRIYDRALKRKSIEALHAFGRSPDLKRLRFLREFGDMVALGDFSGRYWDEGRGVWSEGATPVLRFTDPLAGVWRLAGATVISPSLDSTASKEAPGRIGDYPVYSLVASDPSQRLTKRIYQVYEDTRHVGRIRFKSRLGDQEIWTFVPNASTPPLPNAEFVRERFLEQGRSGWQLHCKSLPSQLAGFASASSSATSLRLRRRSLVDLKDLTVFSKREWDQKEQAQKDNDNVANSFLFGNTLKYWEQLYGGYNVVKMDGLNLYDTGLGERRIFAGPSRRLGGAFHADTNDGRLIPFNLRYIPKNEGGLDKVSTLASTTREASSMQAARIGLPILTVAADGQVSPLGALNSELVKESVSKSVRQDTTIITNAWQYSYVLHHDKDMMRVTDDFWAAVQRLSSKVLFDLRQRREQDVELFRFFDEWGTHYPVAITYGAVGWWENTVTRSEFSATSSTSMKLELSIGEAKTGGEEKETSSRGSLYELSETKARIFGGDASPEGNFQTVTPGAEHAPVLLDLRAMHTVLSPQHFPESPAAYTRLRVLMRDALPRYYKKCVQDTLEKLAKDEKSARDIAILRELQKIPVKGQRKKEVTVQAELVSIETNGASFAGQIVLFPTHPQANPNARTRERDASLADWRYDDIPLRLINLAHGGRDPEVIWSGSVTGKKEIDPGKHGVTWTAMGRIADACQIGVLIDLTPENKKVKARYLGNMTPPIIGFNKTRVPSQLHGQKFNLRFNYTCEGIDKTKGGEEPTPGKVGEWTEYSFMLHTDLERGEQAPRLTLQQVREALCPMGKGSTEAIVDRWLPFRNASPERNRGLLPPSPFLSRRGASVKVKIRFRRLPSRGEMLESALRGQNGLGRVKGAGDYTVAPAKVRSANLVEGSAPAPKNTTSLARYPGVFGDMDRLADGKRDPRIPRGAIAYYPFSGNGEERTGLSRPMKGVDPKRFRNHALIRSSELFGVGKLDKYIQVPPRGDGSFTIHMDFSVETMAGAKPLPLIRRGDNQFRLDFFLGGGFQIGNPRIRANGGRAAAALDYRKLRIVEGWHKVICSVDRKAGKLRTWINGETHEMDISHPDFDFGNSPKWFFADEDGVVPGAVDEVIFLGRALSFAEMKELGKRPRLGPGEMPRAPVALSSGAFAYLHPGIFKSVEDFQSKPPAREMTMAIGMRPFQQPDSYAVRTMWLAREKTQGYGLVWNGRLRVPTDGGYEFLLTSAGGSRLWIDGKLVVDNDGVHKRLVKAGKATLRKGLRRVRVAYFTQRSTKNDFLEVVWKGPGFGSKPIAESVFRSPGDKIELRKIPQLGGRWRWLYGADLKTPLRGGLLNITQKGDALTIRHVQRMDEFSKFPLTSGLVRPDGFVAVLTGKRRGRPTYGLRGKLDESGTRIRWDWNRRDVFWERIPEGEKVSARDPSFSIHEFDDKRLDTIPLPGNARSVSIREPGFGHKGAIPRAPKHVIVHLPTRRISYTDHPQTKSKVRIDLKVRAQLSKDGRNLLLRWVEQDQPELEFGGFQSISTLPLLFESRDAGGNLVGVVYVITSYSALVGKRRKR